MRATNIQYLVGLKKIGQTILFLDCPQCKRFFGTNETGVETCSIECDAEYSLRREQFEKERRRRFTELALSKPYI